MRQALTEYIAKAECKHGRIYKLSSRNLALGVWDADRAGFIGVRTKFNSRFLFMEFHWDNGPPFGTAKPVEDTGESIPPDMPMEVRLGTVNRLTGRPCQFDKPVSEGGRGWFDVETGEALTEYEPTAVSNSALFNLLDSFPQ